MCEDSHHSCETWNERTTCSFQIVQWQTQHMIMAVLLISVIISLLYLSLTPRNDAKVNVSQNEIPPVVFSFFKPGPEEAGDDTK